MRKLLLAAAVKAMLGVMLAAVPRAHAGTAARPLPNSMAAIGDSVSQAFDDCCYYGNHPQDSWSTGWLYPLDGVDSHYPASWPPTGPLREGSTMTRSQAPR